jgi:hypothetical protein
LSNCGADHLARPHFEVSYQTLRAVPDVLELLSLYQARPSRLRLMQALKGLHARLFVGAHQVRALGCQLRSLLVSITDLLNVGLILLGSFSLVL